MDRFLGRLVGIFLMTINLTLNAADTTGIYSQNLQSEGEFFRYSGVMEGSPVRAVKYTIDHNNDVSEIGIRVPDREGGGVKGGKDFCRFGMIGVKGSG